MEEQEEKKKTTANAFWPDTSTAEGLKSALSSGRWASVFVAAITAATVGYSVFVEPIAGLDAWGFIDAAIFGICAYGIHRGSRTAALVSLVLYLLNRWLMYEDGTGGFSILALLIVWMMVLGVKGTFAYQAQKKASDHYPDEV